jgi:peptidoglycan/xylan/chitin deacetylase (PgdA/CDA1 family)
MEGKLRISFTFDDGPHTATTLEVLDLPTSTGIRASFFLIGQNITDESKSTIKREIDEGHTVECHSWTHPAFPDLTAEQMRNEVERTNEMIEACTGIAPMFFRPPYIAVNDLMFETIHMPFICGLGIRDWEPDASAEERCKLLLDNVHDGQIILLHDLSGNGKTVEALKNAIPVLKERGAEFFTVRDLFKVCDVNPVRPASEKKVWTDLF